MLLSGALNSKSQQKPCGCFESELAYELETLSKLSTSIFASPVDGGVYRLLNDDGSFQARPGR